MISRRAAWGIYIISYFALCLFLVAGVEASRRKLIESTVIAKSPGAVALKPEGVRVSLELVPEERRRNQTLSARIARLPAGKSLYLVLKNIQANKQPDELYNVYINLKEGKPTAADSPAGTLNFYNFGGSWEGKTRTDVFFSFDVTDVLKKLAAEKSEPIVVTIIPAHPPAEKVLATVGQIELVEQ